MKLRWKARAAVGLMFFAGLRPGEAKGARWEDYTDKRLFVRQSVWHTHTTAPTTEEAASPVPVIDTLAGILRQLREPLLKVAGLAWHGWYSLRRGDTGRADA
jgi:integrase